MKNKNLFTILICAITLSSTVFSLAQTDTAGVKELGPIDVTATQFVFHNGSADYKHAHMKGKDGLTVDADDILADSLSKNVLMTGSIKAHINRSAQSQDITVNADKAIYDRVKNQILLTGNVKVTIYSQLTSGPAVQTGDSAIVQLGAAPEFPLITMDHVHSIFTPAQ